MDVTGRGAEGEDLRFVVDEAACLGVDVAVDGGFVGGRVGAWGVVRVGAGVEGGEFFGGRGDGGVRGAEGGAVVRGAAGAGLGGGCVYGWGRVDEDEQFGGGGCGGEV